jgi:rhodanese-related sulfurtransferase
MTKQFAVVVTMLVLVSAFAGLGIQNACAADASGDSGIEIVAFSTDKDVYSAKEEMTVFLSAYSPENISNALIKVSGVNSSKGVTYVTYSNALNLTAGETTIQFTKKLPSCSRCAGISQGTYVIDASVTYGDEVVTAKHSIAITSQADQAISVNIAVDEAHRVIASEPETELLVVDVRTREEYDAGHIEGALSVPISELNNRTEEFNTSTKIIVYSANGTNSTVVCDILIKNGSARVYNVVGGLEAWNESGYAVVPTAPSSSEVPNTNATSNPMAPGFEAVLALVAVLFVAYRVRRR